MGIKAVCAELQPAPAGLGESHLQGYLDQLSPLLDKHPVEVVIGASMGAVLAWQLVDLNPAPKQLVLINPPPPQAPANPRDQESPVIYWRGNQPLASTRRHLDDCSDADCYFAHQAWRNESALALAQAQQWIPSPRQVPTLLLLGSTDPAAGADQGVAMAQSLAAPCWLIDGAGHLQPLLGECATEVAIAVAKWSLDPAFQPTLRATDGPLRQMPVGGP